MSFIKNKLKCDRKGWCVSNGSGTTLEYAMHCESVVAQIFTGRVRSALFEESSRLLETCSDVSFVKESTTA